MNFCFFCFDFCVCAPVCLPFPCRSDQPEPAGPQWQFVLIRPQESSPIRPAALPVQQHSLSAGRGQLYGVPESEVPSPESLRPAENQPAGLQLHQPGGAGPFLQPAHKHSHSAHHPAVPLPGGQQDTR